MTQKQTTVGQYLVQRLEETGLNHIFGVPGDYVLDFMDLLVQSPMQLVGTPNELVAGYAADGYARMFGVGCAVVTYGVGGLSLVNAAAGALAERVPVIFISGAFHSSQARSGTMMHHMAGDNELQRRVFKEVTGEARIIRDALSAPRLIDGVIRDCLATRRPVYLELPVDLVDAPCPAAEPIDFHQPVGSDPQALAEAVRDAAALINAASRPVAMAAIEIHRFQLYEPLKQFLASTHLPCGTLIGGKGCLDEDDPHFIGVYQGAVGNEHTRHAVENADALLFLGAWLTDTSTGEFTANLPPFDRMIFVNSDRVRIGHHYYDHVRLDEFMPALAEALEPRATSDQLGRPGLNKPTKPFVLKPDAPLMPDRLIERVNHLIQDGSYTVIAETGDAMFGSASLHIAGGNRFIAQSFYLSIGYATGAALGAALAQPDHRVILLTGDGSFQMTAQAVSTMQAVGVNPIIIMLNNDGYVIERVIHDGPYNDIPRWPYDQIPQAFGGDGLGLTAHTEGEYEKALETAIAHPDKLVMINAFLPRDVCTPALGQLGKAMRELSAKA